MAAHTREQGIDRSTGIDMAMPSAFDCFKSSVSPLITCSVHYVVVELGFLFVSFCPATCTNWPLRHVVHYSAIDSYGQAPQFVTFAEDI